MNIDQFRQVVREEVKKAMQDELRDILVEAVEIASRPESHQRSPKVECRPVKIQEEGMKGLSSLLQDTAASMSQEEYRQVLGVESTMDTSDFQMVSEGTDASPSSGVLPDFVSRAAKIFAASNLKDRERHGL